MIPVQRGIQVNKALLAKKAILDLRVQKVIRARVANKAFRVQLALPEKSDRKGRKAQREAKAKMAQTAFLL